MSRMQIPLFTLFTVLFPKGPLQLRVFEPRYMDMISNCMKTDSPFGVCLIREGREVAEAALTYDIGTLATISYWRTRADGLLGITVTGGQRYRILEREVQKNKLLVAEVELIDDEPETPLPKLYSPMAEILQGIVVQLEAPYITMPTHYEDAVWVGARLAELLPLGLKQKQALLELTDPVERLARLSEAMRLRGFY